MFAYITWVVSVPKICIHPNPRPTRIISKWGDNMCPPRRCSIGSVHSWMHGMCCRGRPRWPRDTPLLPHRRLSGLPTGSSRTCSMTPHPAVELGSPSWSNPPLCNTVFTNLPTTQLTEYFTSNYINNDRNQADVYLNHIILLFSLMDKLSLLKTDSPWVASTQNLLTANWFLLLIMIYITQLNMNHRPNSGDETQIFLMSRLAKEIRRRPWIEKYLSQPHSHSFRSDRDHQKSKTSTRFQWSNAATLITHAAVSSHLNSDMHRLLLYRRRKWSVIRHNSILTRNQVIITTVENYRRRRTTAKLKCNENRVRF